MRAVILIILAFNFLCLSAQELNCQVFLIKQVATQSIPQETYDNLENAIKEFMNNTKWTNDKYSAQEKIECSISITVTEEIGTSGFSAEAVVQCSRPIFNSNYNSNLFTYRDQFFSFTYNDGEPLLFNNASFTSNITSLLAYYAYLIIALDYDSFSLMGGTAYLETCRDIVNNASATGNKGWQQQDGNFNRYTVVDLLLTSNHEPMRRFYYEYHRLGLDLMYSEPAKAKNKIYSTFKNIEKVQKNNPTSIFLLIIFTSKADEFANVITEFQEDKRNQTIDLLSRLDIRNKNKYQKAKK